MADQKPSCSDEIKNEFDVPENSMIIASDKTLGVIAAVCSLGSIIAYLSGPAGVPLGIALSTGSGLASSINQKPAPDQLPALLKSIEALQRNEKIKRQTAAINTYWDWLSISQSILNSTDSSNEGSMRDLLTKLDSNWTDESHELYLATVPDTSDVMWEQSAIRTAAAACTSCLISAHSIRCRIFAWLALNAHANGQAESAAVYRTSFKNACKVMQDTATRKKEELQKMIDAATGNRVAMISGPKFEKHQFFWPREWKTMPSPIPTYLLRPEDMSSTNSIPCWFIEDSVTKRFIAWPANSWVPTTFLGMQIRWEKDPPAEAKSTLEKIQKDCRQYCLFATWPLQVIMQSWDTASNQVQDYIKPCMDEKYVPKQTRLEDVKEPHPWLVNAKSVSWAYRLRTTDGESTLSQWTKEYEIATANADGTIKLPVLEFDDFGFRIASKRVVYHRKIVKDSGAKEGYSTLVEARSIDNNTFVDNMPNL